MAGKGGRPHARARSQVGLGELHLQASGYYNGLTANSAACASIAHGITTRLAGPITTRRKANGRPTGEMATASVQVWKDSAAKCDVPYFPTCQTGDDVSPGMGAKAHIVTQRSPDQFERLLRAGQYFSVASSERPKIIFLSAGTSGLKTASCSLIPTTGIATWKLLGGASKGTLKAELE